MSRRQIFDWRAYTKEIQARLTDGRTLRVRQSHTGREASIVGIYDNASLAFRHAAMSADEVGQSAWVDLGDECVGRVYSGGEVVVP